MPTLKRKIYVQIEFTQYANAVTSTEEGQNGNSIEVTYADRMTTTECSIVGESSEELNKGLSSVHNPELFFGLAKIADERGEWESSDA